MYLFCFLAFFFFFFFSYVFKFFSRYFSFLLNTCLTLFVSVGELFIHKMSRDYAYKPHAKSEYFFMGKKIHSHNLKFKSMFLLHFFILLFFSKLLRDV